MRRVSLRAVVDHRDLLVCVVLAVGATAATFAGVSPFVRVFLAIPLVLFVPGYALVSAVFPARVLPAVERLLISVGTSIALTILAGLAIAWVGVSLSPESWAAILASVTLALSVVAWIQRLRLGLTGPGLGVARMPRAGVVMVLVAALITADVLLGSRLIATDQQAPPPTQLWMVPVEGRPNDALIGVRAGGNPADYRLVISVAGEPIYEFEIALGAGETWQRNVNFAAELRERPIVARLYEGSSSVESRFVILQPATNAG